MQTEQDFPARLGLALRSRVTPMVVVSPEEERIVSVAKEVCDGWNPPRPCIAWDNVDGFFPVAGKACPAASPRDPLSALDEIAKADENSVVLLPDFHEYWNNPQVKRKLKNLSRKFRYDRRTIIIVTSSSRIPDEIRNDAVIIRLPPPSFAELSRELDLLVATTGIPETLTPTGREKLVQAALGMTISQAWRSFAKAIVQSRALCDKDIDRVIADKQEVMSQSDALEFSRANESACNVGGLAVLKEWLALRERAFTREAREYGLPAPKGIALIGIPGTGKSLAAKMIADIWHLPLVRLDVGALFGSLVGESEERTRRALSLAEAIAPCILWVDEIEKAFAFGSGDAGTSQRVFAHLLTWMQDKQAPCFVVATANNISALPPELLRKGRFDEIFFLDLPDEEERCEIFSVHLKKRRCHPADYDCARLAQMTAGFVGAEIEQAVIDAMYTAFSDGQRQVATEDIAHCIGIQVPLSVSQRETIAQLRQYLAQGRAISASRQAPAASVHDRAIAIERLEV